METLNTLAHVQFITDYTLVVDNDYDAYREVMDKEETNAKNVSGLSDVLRNEFETYISEVVVREQEEGNALGALLISQMLQGWGSFTFDRIALHYIGLKTEQEVE
jgi:hypothetical protein